MSEKRIRRDQMSCRAAISQPPGLNTVENGEIVGQPVDAPSPPIASSDYRRFDKQTLPAAWRSQLPGADRSSIAGDEFSR